MTTAKDIINTVYILHGQVLEFVASAKYLEFDICDCLSWNTNIDCITANANRILSLIKRNIKTKNPQVPETTYNTLIRAQLEYAAPVCYPCTKQKILNTLYL